VILPILIAVGTLVLGLWPRDRGSEEVKCLAAFVLIGLIALWAHWY
jgi:hypothetical protein